MMKKISIIWIFFLIVSYMLQFDQVQSLVLENREALSQCGKTTPQNMFQLVSMYLIKKFWLRDVFFFFFFGVVDSRY